jgi:hypothetical protein
MSIFPSCSVLYLCVISQSTLYTALCVTVEA